MFAEILICVQHRSLVGINWSLCHSDNIGSEHGVYLLLTLILHTAQWVCRSVCWWCVSVPRGCLSGLLVYLSFNLRQLPGDSTVPLSVFTMTLKIRGKYINRSGHMVRPITDSSLRSQLISRVYFGEDRSGRCANAEKKSPTLSLEKVKLWNVPAARGKIYRLYNSFK